LARWSFWRRRSKKSADGTLELFREIFGYPESKSGQSVSFKTALQVATVLACARVLAEGVAQVPLKIFREDGRNRETAKDHALYWVLFRRPNPWQTSFQYRETMMMHLVLCGAHYSFINRVQGQIVELIPFEPGQVTVKRDALGERRYTVRINDTEQQFPQSSIWHINGPSWNGWMGLEPVMLAREAIGLSMAIEEQQAGFYERGTQMSGVYSVPNALTEEQYKKLRDWLEKEHAGSKNSGRPGIIDRGAKWIQTSMTGVDAQTLEQRKYQVEEMCRALRVMPIMVGHSDKAATYASAEQMFLAHVVHSLAPWYERIEQDIDVNLIGEQDSKDGVYAKFIEEGLLRGALKDTASFIDSLVNGGIMSPNEGRDKLDLNPDSDPASDKLRVPVNVAGKPSADKTTDPKE